MTTEPAGRTTRVMGRVGALVLSATYLWVVVMLALWVLGPMIGFRWQPVMIDAGSMEPAIHPGDVVLIDTNADPTGLAPGTIITFDDPVWPDVLVTHRVIQRLDDGTYRTRGDAAAVNDSTPIHPDAIMGTGRLLVPYIGLPTLWFRDAPAAAAIWVLLTVTAWVFVARINDLDPTLTTSAIRTRRPRGRLARWWSPAAPIAGRVRRWAPTTIASITAAMVVGELGPMAGVWPVAIFFIDPRGPEVPLGRWHRAWTTGRLTRRLKPVALGGTLLSGVTVVVTLASAATFVAASSNPTNSFGAATLAPPTNLTASQSCSGTNPTVTLNWTPTGTPQASGYVLQRDADPTQSITPASASSSVDATVANNTAYTWTLRASRGSWVSPAASVGLTTSCASPPPTFVSNTSFQQLGASATHTVPGSAQAGDLLLTFTGTGNSSVTPPAGWNLLRAVDEVTEDVYARIYWRIATAGDPGTPYTWTSGGSTYSGASVMLVFRGVDQTTPFDDHTGVAYIKQTALTVPSITTTVANTRLVTMHFHEEGSDMGNTITPDPAMTEIYEAMSPSRLMEVAIQPIAGTGATGSRTATSADNDDGISFMLAIRPAQ